MFNRFLELTKLGSRVRTVFNEKADNLLVRTIKECKLLYGDEAWYYPTPWLADGNLATIYCTIADFSYESMEYERCMLRVPDGGQIGVDLTFTDSMTDGLWNKSDTSPILVVCHGLTGGSHESYVINVLDKVTKLGWRGAVVNYRGCANTKITGNKLYSGGYTDDLRCAVAFIKRMCPNAPLYGIGFSLGANVLAKYLGEEKDKSPFSAAVVLAGPWDFEAGNAKLHSTALKRVYSRAMAKNLRTLLYRHRDVFENDKRLDWKSIFGNPNQSLYEFDSQVTCVLNGYPSADAYYHAASAAQYAEGIVTPLLSWAALDDPIVATSTVPFSLPETNPNVAFAVTDSGGHLGWFENAWNPRRWISKPVVEFLMTFDKLNESKVVKYSDDLIKSEESPDVYFSPTNSLVGYQLISTGKEDANAADDGLVQGL